MTHPFEPSSPQPLSGRPRWLVGLGIAVLAVAAHATTLRNPFVYDDFRVVVENRSLVPPLNVAALLWHDASRPVANLTYALDRALWGSGPWGFHLTNLVLHVLNVVLFWRVAGDLGRQARRPTVVAGVAASLLAVHPLLTQAVGYVSSRPEVLCTTFLLVALIAERRAMHALDPWGLLAIGAWLLAAGSKEVGLVLPILLLLGDRWAGVPGRAPGRTLRLHVPMLLLAAALVAIRLAVFAGLEHAEPLVASWPLALVEIDVFRRYATMLVAPGEQAIFHAVAPVEHILSSRALGGLALLTASLAGAWAWRRRHPAASVGLVWFPLALLPSALLVVLDRGEPMAEHRVYLASLGWFLAAGVLWEAWDRWLSATPVARRTWRIGAVVLLGILAGRTTVRHLTWHDPVMLWTEASIAAPDHWLPYVPLGESLHRAGRHDEAAAAFGMALQRNAPDVTVPRKLGVCLLEGGYPEAAASAFAQAAARHPSSWEAPAGLAMASLARGDLAGAQQHLESARRQSPTELTAVEALAALAAVVERAARQ